MNPAWTFGSLVVDATGHVHPIALPNVMTDPGDAVGYSITLCCPTGCKHVLGIEPNWPDTLQMAAHRLEHTPAPDGFLVVGVFPAYAQEQFNAVKEATDAAYRGTAN